MKPASEQRSLLVVLFVGAALLATAWGAQTASAEAPAPTLSCAASAVYGDVVACTASGTPGGRLVWPDGVELDADIAHAPKMVGEGTVQLLDRTGVVVAAAPLAIAVDLEASCADQDLRPIYELVRDASRAEGWNYVYLHPETGQRVLPGAPDYPIDPGMTPYEAVMVGEGAATGLCEAHSLARDELGGTIEWIVDSGWGEPHRIPFDSLIPWARHHWNGTQPGVATVTVTVNGVPASEREGVYLSGCS